MERPSAQEALKAFKTIQSYCDGKGCTECAFSDMRRGVPSACRLQNDVPTNIKIIETTEVIYKLG